MSKQSEDDKKQEQARQEQAKQDMKDCYPSNMSSKERAEFRWKNFMEAWKSYERFIK